MGLSPKQVRFEEAYLISHREWPLAQQALLDLDKGMKWLDDAFIGPVSEWHPWAAGDCLVKALPKSRRIFLCWRQSSEAGNRVTGGVIRLVHGDNAINEMFVSQPGKNAKQPEYSEYALVPIREIIANYQKDRRQPQSMDF